MLKFYKFLPGRFSPEQVSCESFVVVVGPGLVGPERDDRLLGRMHSLRDLKNETNLFLFKLVFRIKSSPLKSKLIFFVFNFEKISALF